MAKYIVRAESEGVTRDEIIDTSRNELFKNCKHSADVKTAYEAFWGLDKYSPTVNVLGVLPLNPKIKHFKGDPVVKVKGWKHESARHGLAAKGIKTGRKKKTMFKIVPKGYTTGSKKGKSGFYNLKRLKQ